MQYCLLYTNRLQYIKAQLNEWTQQRNGNKKWNSHYRTHTLWYPFNRKCRSIHSGSILYLAAFTSTNFLIFSQPLSSQLFIGSIAWYLLAYIHLPSTTIYRMSSIESSSSEGRYCRRRRRNDYQTLSTNFVESSILLQCTAAVVFPTLSTNIDTIEEPSTRIYRTYRHRTRRKSMISSSYLLVMTAMMIISIITVNNNCYCYAFQSPAVIQRSTGLRIQHVVSAIVGRALSMSL
jgi:hypothetical protein